MSRVDIAPGAALFTRVDPGPDSDAPWIVLSNSLAADHAMWNPQMPLLTGRYNVLRYDTRGHGASDAPAGPYSFDMLVADVAAVMDFHQVRRATYMGLSLGGMTGLGLALAHPERVERLVCCDARADAPEGFVKSWDDRIASVEAGGMESILAVTVERWLVPSFRAAHPDAVADIRRMILATQPAGYRGCAEALKRLDYLKDLGRLAVPTLYVVGAEDGGAPPAVMQAMADATPGARMETVPEAAHIANVDNAKGFEKAVSGFLGLR